MNKYHEDPVMNAFAGFIERNFPAQFPEIKKRHGFKTTTVSKKPAAKKPTVIAKSATAAKPKPAAKKKPLTLWEKVQKQRAARARDKAAKEREKDKGNEDPQQARSKPFRGFN